MKKLCDKNSIRIFKKTKDETDEEPIYRFLAIRMKMFNGYIIINMINVFWLIWWYEFNSVRLQISKQYNATLQSTAIKRKFKIRTEKIFQVMYLRASFNFISIYNVKKYMKELELTGIWSTFRTLPSFSSYLFMIYDLFMIFSGMKVV